MLSELLLDDGVTSFLSATGYALANLLEVVLAAFLIRRPGGGRDLAFANVPKVLLFAASAMGLAPGLTALLGTWAHYDAGQERASFLSHWPTWWIGDGMGMLVLTPLLLGWLHEPAEAPHPMLRTG